MSVEQHLALFEDVVRSMVKELGLTPQAACEIEQALVQVRAAKSATTGLEAFFAGPAGTLMKAAAITARGRA